MLLIKQLLSHHLVQQAATVKLTEAPAPRAFRSISTVLGASAESSELQHVLHHRSDSVKYLVYGSVAHEGRGGDQLVLLVHVALADALAHVLAAQLVDGVCSAGGVGVPERTRKKKEAPLNVLLLEEICHMHKK